MFQIPISETADISLPQRSIISSFMVLRCSDAVVLRAICEHREALLEQQQNAVKFK